MPHKKMFTLPGVVVVQIFDLSTREAGAGGAREFEASRSSSRTAGAVTLRRAVSEKKTKTKPKTHKKFINI